MRTFREVAGRELAWVRVGPRKARQFELRAADERVAELVFESTRADHARARSGDGVWRFERRGVTRPEIRLTSESAGTTGTTGTTGTAGTAGTTRAGGGDPTEGVLRPDRLFRPVAVEVRGRRYTWRREALFSPWRSLEDETGPLIRTRPVGLGVTGRGRLGILAAAFARPELPLLALVGWYLTARSQGRESI